MNSTPAENPTPAGDPTPADNPPTENAPAENAPAENAPENAPVENAPVENAPVENAPVENAPVENAPVENAPVGNPPAENPPAENPPPPAADPPAADPPAPVADPPAPENTIQPRIFDFNHNLTKDVPVLADEDIDDFSAVLRGLARGTFPRLDAIPNALNAYNLTQADDRKAWAYFHEITEIYPADDRSRRPPRIELDDEVLADLKLPWQGMRPNDSKPVGKQAHYRFICFIHKHRVNTRYSGQKAAYTISIWDREMDWMMWHDMYPHGRSVRQRDVEHFWEFVIAPGIVFLQNRHEFMRQMLRWRVNYHACEKMEAALRDIIAPRYTLWAVMSIALHHMNLGSTVRHVYLIPDRFEVFAGSEAVFLPTMFVRLLWLCIRAPRVGEEDTWNGRTDGFNRDEDLKRFVEQFRIVDRLAGMKTDVRNVVKSFIQEGSMDWVRGVTWFFPALRLPPL